MSPSFEPLLRFPPRASRPDRKSSLVRKIPVQAFEANQSITFDFGARTTLLVICMALKRGILDQEPLQDCLWDGSLLSSSFTSCRLGYCTHFVSQ